MYRYDAVNSGVAPDLSGPVDGIEIQWVANLRWISDPPVIVDGTMYVGTHGPGMRAIHPEVGEQLWNVETADHIQSAPAAVDDLILAPTSSSTLHALDPADGSEVWSFVIDGDRVSHSAPTVVDKTVYFGSRDVGLLAIDGTDGTEQWRNDVSDSFNWAPAVNDDKVYAPTTEDILYALHTTDGTELWSADLEAIDSPIAVADGVGYIASASSILAIGLDDGSEIWEYEMVAESGGTPAVSDDSVYTIDADGTVYNIDREDGTLRWGRDRFSWTRRDPSLVVVDDVIYAENGHGVLAAWDATDGTFLWQIGEEMPDEEEKAEHDQDDLADQYIFGRTPTTPVVLDDRIFFGTVEGYLYALAEPDYA